MITTITVQPLPIIPILSSCYRLVRYRLVIFILAKGPRSMRLVSGYHHISVEIQRYNGLSSDRIPDRSSIGRWCLTALYSVPPGLYH